MLAQRHPIKRRTLYCEKRQILVLDRFQDSSKTGSGINFSHLSCRLFADFFGTAYLRPVQKTRYFEYEVQKSVAVFLGGEWCVCVEVSLRTACCCQKQTIFQSRICFCSQVVRMFRYLGTVPEWLLNSYQNCIILLS